MADPIEKLYADVLALRKADVAVSRTAKLLREGTVKAAKKLAEEAVEVGHEAILGNRKGTIEESADTLYNLVVLWADMGIRPEEVWAEMHRREVMMGIAEKLPKTILVPSPASPGKMPGRVRNEEKSSKRLRGLRGWLGLEPPKAKPRKKR